MRSWRSSFSARPFELVDEIDEVEEPSSSTATDDGGSDGDAQMGFAGSGSTDKDAVALGVQKSAGRELANLPLIHGCVGEDEAIKILQHRELGAADAIADRACLPVRAFGADQTGDQWVEFITPCKALSGDLVEAGAHAVKLQLAHGL